MERAATFFDAANIEAAFRARDAEPDFPAIQSYLAAGRFVIDAFLYLPLSPYDPRGRTAQLRELRRHGFFIRTKLGKRRPNGGWKCDFDIEICIDVLRIVFHARIDIVVLVTGDGDLVPLALELRERGIRVEVAAVPGSVSVDLRNAAAGFVDLSGFGRQASVAGLNSATNGQFAAR